MGGKPNSGTKADQRLKVNNPNVGKPKKPPMPQKQPPPKKAGK
jgi:hypothetical protein